MNRLSNSGPPLTAFQIKVLESEVTVHFSAAPGSNVKKNIVDILTASFERRVQEYLFADRNEDCAKM